MRRLVLLALLVLLGLQPSLAPAADKDVGIVLLHGKWDRAPTHVMGLARQLEAQGFLVATPLMPWAGNREYDVPYAQALEDIAAAAQDLRAKGAKHIVVGGQSFGANAALAFAASGKPVDAVFLISPGHTPYSGRMRSAVESSVGKAAEMIKTGAGGDKAWFSDLNQGQSKQVRSTASAYFSYFDPDGLAAMPRTAAAIPAPIPVFLAVGASDAMAPFAEETIFKRAPMHPKSVFSVPAGDHMGLMGVVSPALVTWLQSLGF